MNASLSYKQTMSTAGWNIFLQGGNVNALLYKCSLIICTKGGLKKYNQIKYNLMLYVEENNGGSVAH